MVHAVTASHCHNWCVGTETANHARAYAASGVYHDCFGVDVKRGVDGSMADGVGVVQQLHLRNGVAVFVVHVAFGFFHDASHGGDGVGRIDTHRTFRRQHYATATVVYCICNVHDFRTSGAQFGHHAFQHFRSGNYKLACRAAFANQHFLYCGQLLVGHFHAEVAARNHYAVAFFYYFIDVVYAALAFYLTDDTCVACTVRQYVVAYVAYALSVLHKTCGVHFRAVFDAEV